MVNASPPPERSRIAALVISALEDVLAQRGRPAVPIDDTTRLIGREAAVDSLGLVTLIVDLEQRLDDEFAVVLTLADERAMSQTRSPFLTVGTLTDHVAAQIAAASGNG